MFHYIKVTPRYFKLFLSHIHFKQSYVLVLNRAILMSNFSILPNK